MIDYVASSIEELGPNTEDPQVLLTNPVPDRNPDDPERSPEGTALDDSAERQDSSRI